MDSAANARPFPFFKLPAELRDNIYRLVIVTGQNLIIKDMHLDEFEESQENGSYQRRSTYLATDHVCDRSGWLEDHHIVGSVDSCSFRDPIFPSRKTTYKVKISTFDFNPTTNTFLPWDVNSTTKMLSVNKQSRSEAASIFYGENAFRFSTMSSLVPFMKDRMPETRNYIQSLHLILTVDDRDWDAVFAEYGRPATWNTTFSTLAELPQMNISKILIHVDDSKAKLLTDGIKLRSRSMLWLHKLSKVENLDMLGVEYCVRYRNTRQLRVKSNTEEELWRFLAPRMLKREADDHSPDALQERRIWGDSDTFLSRSSYYYTVKR